MKTSQVKSTISGPLKLTREAWYTYRAGFRDFALIVLIVTLPINFFNIWLPNDTAYTAYTSFASIIMNLALIYTVVQRLNGATGVTLREAYYDGTRALVRFLLVALTMVLAVLPAIVGLFIYSIEQSAALISGTTLAQDLTVAGVALVIALPSLWWLTRWAFALFIVVDEDLRPIEALRSSRERTLGMFWRTLGRLAFLLVILVAILLVVVVPPAILANFFPGLAFITQLFQTLFSLVALPIASIYLVLLSRELAARHNGAGGSAQSPHNQTRREGAERVARHD